MPQTYPKMLYRDEVEFGESCITWDGRKLETVIVVDADEEAEAIVCGWSVDGNLGFTAYTESALGASPPIKRKRSPK